MGINSTDYVVSPANQLALVDRVHTRIPNYTAVCLGWRGDRNHTQSAISEPTLLKAAFLVMKSFSLCFQLVDDTREVLSGILPSVPEIVLSSWSLLSSHGLATKQSRRNPFPKGESHLTFTVYDPLQSRFSFGVPIFDSVMKTTCRHSCQPGSHPRQLGCFSTIFRQTTTAGIAMSVLYIDTRPPGPQHWCHAFYSCLCGNTHLDVKKVDLIIIIRATKDDVSENS